MRPTGKIKLMLMAAGVLCIVFLNPASALPAKKLIKNTSTLKEVTGQVAWLGYNTISIIPNANLAIGSEDEILFTFERKKVGLEHLKDLSEVSKGDSVRIQYNEQRIQYEGEPEQLTLKLKVIGFVSKGKPEPQPKPVEESGMEVLGSEQE